MKNEFSVKRGCRVWLLLTICASPVMAFINPGFTPSDLIGQSNLVAVGRLTPTEDKAWQLSGIEVLKGTLGETLRMVVPSPKADEEIRFGTTVGQGAYAVILRGRDGSGKLSAFCFVNGSWFEAAAGEGEWRVRAHNQNLLGTFAGDAEMLGRTARRLVANPKMRIPTTAGLRWFAAPVVGTVEGAGSLALLRLGEGGTPHVYVASERGDRIFEVKGRRNFKDVSEQVGLTARSRLVAILDATRNGQDDVVSWDGETLRLFAFADGGFGEGQDLLTLAECLGLAPVLLDGRPGVLISRSSAPVLLLRGESGEWSEVALPEGVALEGEPGPALAADFTQDGRFDILQTGSGGSRLWRGIEGGFAAATGVPVKGGPGSLFALADFDEDGLLDLYLNSEKHHGIWENDGQGGFENVTHKSGWYGSKAVSGAVAVIAEDMNFTHMPDIGLFFTRDPVQYHFNRGFRTFAEEGEVRLAELPKGTQVVAVITADFNRDGSADLAVATDGGQIVVFFNELYDLPALRVMLPPGAATGPVTVTAYDGEVNPAKRLGVYSVDNGGPGRHVTLGQAPNAILAWRNAAGEEQALTVKADPMQTIPVVLEPAR